MTANGAMEDSDSGSDLEPEVTEDDAGGESEPTPRRAKDDDAPAPSRKERRGNKMAEERAAREQAETQAREYRERLDRQEQQIAEMRGYLAAQHQRQQQNPNDTVEKKIDALDDEAHGLLEHAARLNAAGDAAGSRAAMKKRDAVIREATILAYEARANPKLDERFQQMQSSMPDPQVAATYSQAIQEFPWLTTDDEAATLVNDKLGKLLKQGRPRSIATIREAATAVAKRLNLGGRQAPTPQQRQRFNGVSAGEGGGGEGGSRAMPEDNKTNRTLAQKSFKDLEPKKAWAAWCKMVMESEDDE